MTLSTIPPATRDDIGVFFGKLVSVVTEILRGVYSRWAFTTQEVLFMGYCLEMVGINTYSISAEMI
jgi:hypothetical protein